MIALILILSAIIVSKKGFITNKSYKHRLWYTIVILSVSMVVVSGLYDMLTIYDPLVIIGFIVSMVMLSNKE